MYHLKSIRRTSKGNNILLSCLCCPAAEKLPHRPLTRMSGSIDFLIKGSTFERIVSRIFRYNPMQITDEITSHTLYIVLHRVFFI